MTVVELIASGASQFTEAKLAFGHGTNNARDEATWLVLPLDTPLEGEDSKANMPVALADVERIAMLFAERIRTRKPAAYLTHEAWLQGVSFYVDERVIVPRSLIAELMADGSMDYWLKESTQNVLDLCTGSGSLAILAALTYPEVTVTGSDLSANALAVAHINVAKHELEERIMLVESDGFTAPELQTRGPFDLIMCTPPYVNAASMATLPPEYRAEPALALDGNTAGSADGMDFVRVLMRDAAQHMSDDAVLVLEIGNERDHFEAAFPHLDAIWLQTSAGEDQVLLLGRETLQQKS